MPMKAVVIGGNGQLGSDLTEVWSAKGWEVVPLTHADISVEDPGNAGELLGRLKPAVVLNTAAFHNVPQCEKDPDRSFRVNALGALNVSRGCETIGARHVYFSTDYVFDGVKRSPYLETDAPNPLNIYGATKLTGEYFALNYAARACVIRVSGIYGSVPCRAKGGNFVTTMLKAAREKPAVNVVDDEVLTPTPTREIARAALELVDADARGLFHLTCEGSCSWYEFARVIFDTLGLTTPLLPVSLTAFPSPVRRPSYSVMENMRAKSLGTAAMPDWKPALIEFLRLPRA